VRAEGLGKLKNSSHRVSKIMNIKDKTKYMEPYNSNFRHVDTKYGNALRIRQGTYG
jgi:hypothetical protein